MEYQTKDLTGAHLDVAVALALAAAYVDGKGCPLGTADLVHLVPETLEFRGDHYVGYDRSGNVVLLVCDGIPRVKNKVRAQYGLLWRDYWDPVALPAQGQPILEKFQIGAQYGRMHPTLWNVEGSRSGFQYMLGRTMLEAGLRAFVRQQLGTTIELPTEEDAK